MKKMIIKLIPGFLALLSLPVLPGVITVSSGGSIQTAINGARAGDTIAVSAGTFTGNLTISGKTNLTLLGSGAAVLQGTGAAAVITADGRNIVIDGFTIAGGQRGIMTVWPHVINFTITNDVIADNRYQTSERLGGGGLDIAGGDTVIIRNNSICRNACGLGAGIYGGARNMVIEDNLIDSNMAYSDHGGGIFLAGTAVIRRNIFQHNQVGLGFATPYGWGGGIIVTGTATMSYNVIRWNSVPGTGGGVFCDEGGTLHADHELIYGNRAERGAGVYVDGGAPGTSHLYLTNSTICYNVSTNTAMGNGVYMRAQAWADVRNCIFWGNGIDFTAAGATDTLLVNYSVTHDSWPGTGLIAGDPLFADTAKHDFHVKSAHGRWDSLSGSWVADAATSPAIDAGDPSSDFSLEPAGNGGRVNLGRYGNTPEASKSSGGSTADESRLAAAGGAGLQVSVFPNPITAAGIIQYYVPAESPVTLSLYTVQGILVKTLVQGGRTPGWHQAGWNVRGYPVGIYLLKARAGGFSLSRKVMLVSP